MGIIRKNVALEPEDYKAIEAVRSSKGLGSRGFSAALRLIIRHWVENKSNERVRITEAGREALKEDRP